LSIIMPACNAGKHIAPAIQSVLDQTYENFELIIINDGSTDNSKAVIESFDDNRIKYFENEKNSGIVFSRNKGLKLAQGEYIGMLDADDIAHPEKFEKQITFLEQNHDFGMVGSWAKFIDGEGKRLPGAWKLKAKPEMIPSIMLFKNYFLQSAVLYRRECIEKFSFKEGFDILEDYLIWLEIIRKYKAWNLPEYLIDYRLHPGGVTKMRQEEKREKEKMVFRIQLEKLGIDATDKEIKLHLLIRDDTPITKTGTLKSVEKWLLKISAANEALGVYNRKMLARTVFNRWLKVCFKASGLHMNMLYYFLRSKILFSVFR
ncbi:MAG: glycosyltransferase, partial [Bacteroidales bacterium]|nr:glycosyltransferase [Bacteroidales bacterium]